MSEVIPAAAYNRLLKTLRIEIRQSIDNIRRYADRQRVLAYWNIGRAVGDYAARHGSSAGLYERLAADTGIHLRTLQQCVQFAAAYPRLDPEPALSWSHYRYLMSVDSPAERSRWEERALQEGWNGNQLLRFIRAGRTPEAASLVKGAIIPDAIPVRRGVLHAYRIVKVSYAQDVPGGFMVDCGFEIRIPPPPSAGTIDNTRVVTSQKDEASGVYRLKLGNIPVGDIYTYKAVVERVVDGDTLIANIDCGFDIWIRQRLRLRGIDAPELRTIAGDRARAWVAERLASCPFVVIKTYKTDKYDRYLADVFYRPPTGDADDAPAADDEELVAAQGALLNVELLHNGLAQPWQPG